METITIPLLIALLLVSFPSSHSKNASNYHSYLNKACDGTPHRKLCTHSLAAFSHSIPIDGPRWWTHGAISVTVSEFRHISNYLAKNHQGSAAYTDCIECMRDGTVQLQSSDAELKHLDKTKFALQMNDIKTWVSAALTDANTCTEGLMYYKGEQVGSVKHKVLKAAHLCSNALAFVNNLASSGNIN